MHSSRATAHLKHDYCEWEQGLVKGVILLVNAEAVQECGDFHDEMTIRRVLCEYLTYGLLQTQSRF